MSIERKIYKALVEGNLLEKIYQKIKKILITNVINGKYRKALFSRVDRLIQKCALKKMSEQASVENNKIVFLTFSGDYNCNPRGICAEIIRQGLPYKLIWGIYKKQETDRQYPRELKKMIRGSYEFYRELCSAKIIIDNGVSTAHLNYEKKPDQILIETWHGSLGIKKFSPDTVKDKKWVKKAYKEASMTDYIISNSSFEDDVYREDYWKDTEIWQFGHARNDILFKSEKWPEVRDKIYSLYNIPEGSKVCMYAPTFRDDGDLSPYCINYDALKHTLEERFGGNWVILTRFHYRIIKKIKNYKFPEGVINVTDYPDIQDLMTVTDVGITDYSSWICEFFLTRRPSFIFATDKDTYTTEQRAFFFPLEELPSPVSGDVPTLLQNMAEFDAEKYVRRCNEFLADKGSIDDGHASERIVEKIKEIMGA